MVRHKCINVEVKNRFEINKAHQYHKMEAELLTACESGKKKAQ